MIDVTESFVYNFTNSLAESQGIYVYDFKVLFSKCLTEIMARSVYDVRKNSNANLDTLFYRNLRTASENFGIDQWIRIFMAQTFPAVAKVSGRLASVCGFILF